MKLGASDYNCLAITRFKMGTLARQVAVESRLAALKLTGSSTKSFKLVHTGTPKSQNVEASVAATGNVSKAMQAYLERATAYNKFMEEQRQEFQLGRRHLANMMGKDPETFTQDDINEAIRYLFPSGLFQIRARPQMRPPEELYPKQKDAEFDANGRPYHPFFYTSKPNYFYSIHEIVSKLKKLDNVKVSGMTAEQEIEYQGSLKATRWFTREDIEAKLLEKISDKNYSDWETTIDRLAQHPLGASESAFIADYRKPLVATNLVAALPPVVVDADGRKSATVLECWKKQARAQVTVRLPGTGIFKINGKPLDFFETMQSREHVIAPLQRVGWLGTVDVEATVQNGGEQGKASAIRYGIAQCIASLGADVEKLRLAGYLSHDRRTRERKKPGRIGARATWTWCKR